MWYNGSMDGQEYLDRISASNRKPTQGPGSRILGSKFFWVGAIGIGVFILIAVVGAILRGSGGGEKSQCLELLAHIEYTSEMIDEYQPSIKSSDLRSSSASFYSVLTNTDNGLQDYVATKYKVKDIKKSLSQKTQKTIEAERDALDEDLFKAKINGILDRTYADKMAYELSLIMAQEENISDATRDDALMEILDSSYNSLKNLYDKFNNFSEAR